MSALSRVWAGTRTRKWLAASCLFLGLLWSLFVARQLLVLMRAKAEIDDVFCAVMLSEQGATRAGVREARFQAEARRLGWTCDLASYQNVQVGDRRMEIVVSRSTLVGGLWPLRTELRLQCVDRRY